MPRTLVAVLLALTVLAGSACSSGGGETPESPADPAAAPGDGADGAEDAATMTVSPEAQLEGSCEPLPQDDENGTHLVADLVVRNTGNVGIVTRVVATWRQPDGRHLTASKRQRLELDEVAPVRLRIDIGDAEARAVRRAVKRDRPCYTRVRVARAFGAPRQ